MTQAELTQSDITLSRKPTVDMTPREAGLKKRPKGMENTSEVANVKQKQRLLSVKHLKRDQVILSPREEYSTLSNGIAHKYLKKLKKQMSKKEKKNLNVTETTSA